VGSGERGKAVLHNSGKCCKLHLSIDRSLDLHFNRWLDRESIVK
jgi:hypothetical protein